MISVTVRLPDLEYPVYIGEGTSEVLPSLIHDGTEVAAIVTDETVGPLFADSIATLLEAKGLRAPTLQVPSGEAAKTWNVWTQVLEFLEQSGVEEHDAIIALGGGAVGDLAGFASAVWLRGISYYQVGTTLLAMVDSSVGGKTAIDTQRTKNSIGAVWQPVAVVADLAHLRTLPDLEYLSAFAEIIKHGMALDADLFYSVASQTSELRGRSSHAMQDVVARCISAKAAVVAADERESTGYRAILNYGHTVGHALEIATGYAPELLHGQAIAAGMRAAAWISAQLGLCSSVDPVEQDRLLAAFDLPPSPPAVEVGAVMTAVRRDKKSVAGEVRWTLLRAIGRAEVGHKVPTDLATEAVRRVLARKL